MNKTPKSWKQLQDHYLQTIESEWYKALGLLENSVSIATYQFYQKKNLITLHLPVTTGSISSPMGRGSDSLPVSIDMFGVKTYLADSMQFMLEYGCRIYPQGCFYIMPSFRGEKADQRHLCQFYHSEAEIPGRWNKIKELVEEYLLYLNNYMLKEHSTLIDNIAGNHDHIIYFNNLIKDGKVPVITFEEAVCLLDDDEKYINHMEGYRSISSLGEQELMRRKGGYVWLINADELSVPFYQAKNPDDLRSAINGDLLFGIGETVGSGERHSNSNELKEAIIRHDVNMEDYSWYIKMKEIYPMVTSGFGMGIERYLMWLTNEDDIRDFQLLPRFNGVCINP